MIADTTFLIDLLREQKRGKYAHATEFLEQHRELELVTTIITVGELATGYDSIEDARRFFSRIRILSLSLEAALEASRVEYELRALKMRLGENDNWIAGIARYHGEPLISNDKAFSRVRGLQVIRY